MSFQYDSSTSGMSQQSVRGNAGKLVRLLRDIREDYVCAHQLPRAVSGWRSHPRLQEEDNRPIIFVGHSLGGIVIKQVRTL
jgi:hypothetical protein